MSLKLTYDFPSPTKGPHLAVRFISGLCYEAGWKDANNNLIATSVCLAESNGYVEAVHVNKPAVLDEATGEWSDADEDWGLWQINNKSHPEVTQAQAFDPVFATAYARKLYEGRGNSFSAWAAYTNGAWKGERALGYAYDGVANYLRMKHNAYKGD